MDLVVFGHLIIELIKVIKLQCLSISCMKSSVKLRKLWTPEIKVQNNFPPGTRHVVQSILFLLRHNPFLARQVSITLYLINLPPPSLSLENKYIYWKYHSFIAHAVSNLIQ